MDDQKTLEARARAIEAWECLELINRHRAHLQSILANHDATIGDNASRRDCMSFHDRLRDLGLTDSVKREVSVTR